MRWVWLIVVGLAGSARADEGPRDRLTLEQALAEATRHPAAQAAAAAGGAARAGERAAGVYPHDPELGVRGGVLVDAETSEVGPAVGLELSQGLELVDRGALRVAAAAARTEGVAADGVAQAARVAAGVRVAFGDALRARELATLAAGEVELAEALVTVAERRVRAGDAPEVEAAMARIERSRARRRLAAARGELDVACVALGGAIGRASPVEPAGDLMTSSHRGIDALVAQARERHPDLAPLRAARTEALARADLAASRRTPDLGVGAFWDLDGAEHTAGITLSLRLPAFDTGAEEATAARAEAAAHEAALAARAAEVEADIRAAHARLVAAEDEARLAAEDLPPVHEALTLLRTAWERGQIRQAEVLVLRRELLEAEREAIVARAAAWSARAALETAVGGDVP